MRHALTFATAAMLVLTSAVVVGAQDRPQRPQPQAGPGPTVGGPTQGRMPMPGALPAARVLQMRGALALSDDQIKRLETLAASQRTTLEPNRGAMLRARADMADAMKGEGNLDAARAALDKMSRLHNDEVIAHLKAMQETRAVLTAEQRDTMRAMMPMGMGMHHPDAGGPNGMGGPGSPGVRRPGGPGARLRGGPPPDGDEHP